VTASRRIAVAMSGGVDSSVAAALLVEAGEEVFGLMLRLWNRQNGYTNRCCSPKDMANARQIAGRLGIPFYVLDAQQLFKRQVVDFFADGYAQGLTPNPCMECNRSVRWDFLLRQALALGATHLATGHYARVVQSGGEFELLRAVDRSKDQSYVLSVLGQAQLRHAVFPLGEMTKAEVRDHARQLKLAVADRRESQDLCFVGGGDYRGLLQELGVPLPPPGAIVDRGGTRLGQHSGLSGYTIGQRKGLGVAASQPLYVLSKEGETNTLVVGTREELGTRSFHAGRMNWVSDRPPAQPVRALVRVRYRAREVLAEVRPRGPDRVEVELDEPLPDVAPGQAAVFYERYRCLGGGTILA
jgi:tRNA-specific 2-thiouridylase